MKQFLKEIKDTYEEENKTYKKECDDWINPMETNEFYILKGWVEALNYVLKLAKKKGLDK